MDTNKEVPLYEDYLRLQKKDLASFERANSQWSQGIYTTVEYLKNLGYFYPEQLILDCACGDGTSIKALQQHGMQKVIGVEFNSDKAIVAEETGCQIFQADFHDLNIFMADVFDVIFSSHSLEHAYNPLLVLKEFHRILSPYGKLIIIVPYPDYQTNGGHCGRFDLKTDVPDNAQSCAQVFQNAGFVIDRLQPLNVREPEILIICHK